MRDDMASSPSSRDSKSRLSSPTTTTSGVSSPFEVPSAESESDAAAPKISSKNVYITSENASATSKSSLTHADSTSASGSETGNKADFFVKTLGGFGESKFVALANSCTLFHCCFSESCILTILFVRYRNFGI